MPKKTKEMQYFEAIGRRKEAVSRVRLYIIGKDKTATVEAEGTKTKVKAGDMLVNRKPLVEFFSSEYEQKRCMLPFELTNTQGRFAVSVLLSGGGKHGQLEATILGIARALNIADRDTFRPVLKSNNLLTRDARARERRKVGHAGKARKKKQSPKR